MNDIIARAAPLSGLAGGLMIGLASALMLLGAGRVAGVSGFAARAVGVGISSTPRMVAGAFVLGLPLGALLLALLHGPVAQRFPASPLVLIAGGLLVGFGTRLGAGCTSGHGVCGLSRLSPRSMVATLTFMAMGMLTVGVLRALGLMW
ncbi:YeeE/YedE family protein [Acidisphaera rubrifaciens]|uniref:Uncharacterized protein n=1 Tax=Acidisphaera rubrifaciens HS-AP3 TaxID=1231350 RepID=A0A0D6P733_9PROT|nr:YeeE/YedE thiosulfate transporter family protein [Acidisphaera rubrifaciens]GAN76664.1 hypothetical protein Asru_0140_02 [Acidisphaera rubrifaciens HS-AP3]